MRLVCLVVVFFHRQACLLGGQTTNRIFNYAADIPSAGLFFFGLIMARNWQAMPSQASGKSK